MNDIDADTAQMIAVADAGNLQQMRAADRARGDDHLARGGDENILLALAHDDAGATLSLKRQPLRQRVRDNPQIASALGRSEKRLCRRGAKTLLAAVLRIADAFLGGAVVIRIEGNAAIDGRRNEAVGQRQHGAILLDRHRAVTAMIFVRADGVGFGFLEIGQDVVIAPAAAAHLCPAVVVARVAAHVEHAVDRRRAAQHFSARPVQRAPAGAFLGFCKKIPVQHGVAMQLQRAGGDVNERARVGRPSLDQHDARAVCAQPVRQHAAGRAGTDDDVVGGDGVACECDEGIFWHVGSGTRGQDHVVSDAAASISPRAEEMRVVTRAGDCGSHASRADASKDTPAERRLLHRAARSARA